MKTKRQPIIREMSIADAISEAFSEIQSLAEEMREAFDNTPENLQGGDVGQQREAAADELESIDEVTDIPEGVGGWRVSVAQFENKRPSRSDRRDDACQILDLIAERMRDAISEREDDLADLADDDTTLDDWREFEEAITEAKDNAEGVEFPGMFG